MGEFLPLFLGVGVGAVFVSSGRRKAVASRTSTFVSVLCAALLGALASWINNELNSPLLILFDMIQVAAACAMTTTLVRATLRFTSRPPRNTNQS
jgi:hypothetical protein